MVMYKIDRRGGGSKNCILGYYWVGFGAGANFVFAH